MFTSLKHSIRSLQKSKAYVFLNLLGLCSGLVVFILIMVYTNYEFSYDRYHSKADNIYRVYKTDRGNYYKGSNKYAVVPTPLAPALVQDFPEAISCFRIDHYGNNVIAVEDEYYLEKGIYAADPQIFSILDFELLKGSKSEILTGPDGAAISESIAMKYFGRTDVLGEIIKYRDETPYKINGVFKDMPKTSHFVVEVVLNLEGAQAVGGRSMNNWDNSNFYAFIELSPEADPAALEAKLPELRAKYADDPIDSEEGQESTYYLQALKDVHFTKDVNFDIAPNVDASALYIYVGIAFLILIIAAINYINLATARAVNRTKEIGIRKVIGAQKLSLIRAYYQESALIVFSALALAVLVLVFVLPEFSSFIDKALTLDFSSLTFWLFLLTLGALLTLLSGIYPALMLSKFKPLVALKGNLNSSKSNARLRNVLVVFQFSISCALILGASVLSKQLNFIQNMDTGYTRDQIVVLGIRDRNMRAELDVFKDELRRIPGVKYVSSSNSLPNNISSNGSVNWVGKPEDAPRVVLYTNTADYDHVDLYDLEIVEGRNFDPSIPTDENAVLINESAVEALGWEEPIGMQMMTWFGDTGRVVGVLKDFHAHSVHLEIEPIRIFQRSGQFNLSIRLEGENFDDLIKEIENTYYSFNPIYPFEYNFFNDLFDRAYLTEMKTAKLSNWFTGLAILIACLGLYGLAAHKVQHKIKEVGVRKVLGASVTRILLLLTRDFGMLLILSFSLAAPVAYLIMDNWLDGFAYHTTINVLTFVVALLLMLLVAGLTVGFRTYRAAIRNPVDALREE